MFKTPIARFGMCVSLVLVSSTSIARAPEPMFPAHPEHPNSMHRHHKPTVKTYHRSGVPHAANFMIISGIMYAVINGLYYQQHGDQYVYVANPPVNSTAELVSNSNQVGQVVKALPNGSKSVFVNGTNYFVHQGVWYALMAGSNQFVIVKPQL